MKKIMTLLLALAMLASLTACGGSKSGNAGIQSGEIGPGDPEFEEMRSVVIHGVKEPGKVSEDVVYKDHDVTVTVKDLYKDEEGLWQESGIVFELSVNNQSDYPVLVGGKPSLGITINGYMIPTIYSYREFEPHSEDVVRIVFCEQDLENVGANEIADIKLYLMVESSEGDFSDYKNVHVVPEHCIAPNPTGYQDRFLAMGNFGQLFSASEVLQQAPLNVNQVNLYRSREDFEGPEYWFLTMETENVTDHRMTVCMDSLQMDEIVVYPGMFQQKEIAPESKVIWTVNVTEFLSQSAASLMNIQTCSSISADFSWEDENGNMVSVSAPVEIPGSTALTAEGELLYSDDQVDVRYVGASVLEEEPEWVTACLLCNNKTGHDLALLVQNDADIDGREVETATDMAAVKADCSGVIYLLFQLGDGVTGPESLEHFRVKLGLSSPRDYRGNPFGYYTDSYIELEH